MKSSMNFVKIDEMLDFDQIPDHVVRLISNFAFVGVYFRSIKTKILDLFKALICL